MSENTETVAIEESATPVEAPTAETPVVETPVIEAAMAEANTAETPVAEMSTPATEAAAESASGEEVGSEEQAAESSAETSEDNQDSGRVVRTLSVGQPVQGTVKRVSDFGAFVDIGVGRDGLVHISELSVKRVGKVSDVLTAGQEVTFWIKKLDRERNRISLTMIEPGTKTMRDLEKGDVVQGTVTRMMPYGAFIDLGVGRDALLHVREMGERFIARPEDVVTVGEVIEARIIDISRRRSRIDLSLKGLRPEPEQEPEPVQEHTAQEPQEPEPTVEDKFADVEVLSPIELAFKRAMESSGKTIDYKPNKGTKKNPSGRSRARAMQEEALARTLGKQ